MSIKTTLISLVVFLLITGFGYFLFTQFSQSDQFQAATTSESSANEELLASPVSQPEPESIKLLFGGDMMFDRNIRLKMEAAGTEFVLAELNELFWQYDSVIANLEGPVTDNSSRSVNSTPGSTDNFFFTFPVEIVPMLKNYNFQIVNIGNNHIHNFGNDGITQTKSNLEAGEIKYFGDSGLETKSDERVLFYPIKDKTLAFVNYNEFVPNGLNKTLADLEFVQNKADLVIVYTHWGAEYQPTANTVIQAQAHSFIDAGADLVIGSHPHVIQQSEVYEGKTIYYSLGNFVFDQYFSPETQTGMLVGVEIMPDLSMTFEEMLVSTERTGQTILKE
jgi:poly-gamma-glutamate synthesis protein (capsule biosynthesis protein)